MQYFSTGEIQLQEWSVSVRWIIPYFSRCLENITDQEQSLWSPQFSGSSDNGPTWCLVLGESNESCDFLQLGLYMIASSETINIEAKFRLSILNNQQEDMGEISGTVTSNLPGNHHCFHRFVRKDFLVDKANCMLSEDDKLTISCIFDQSRAKFLNVDESLPNDYGLVFDSQEYGDVTIEVDGEEFLVYKGILAARSPVFAAMFKHEMEEQKQNRVTITDVEPNVVREMLTYIYTGRSPNIETMATSLLAVADKYDLERLKLMSEDALCRITSLSAENVGDILTLAELYGAQRLRRQAINYIITHATQLMVTPKWKNDILKGLCKYPDLINEIFKALAIK